MNFRSKLRYKLGKSPTIHKLAISLHGNYCTLTGFLHVLPDFYIIGAAKCGTTSLYDYLSYHPDVFSAFGKELHYFEELHSRGINWYKVCFPTKFEKFFHTNFSHQKFITGEATPRYIDNPHVPKRIKSVTPNAKFILMLRNPIDRAFSHYIMLKNNKIKDLEPLTFEDAIEKEQERIEEEFHKMEINSAYHSEDYYLYGYLDRGIYVKKLEKWFEYFSPDQFLIINSEDFFNNPSKIYEDTVKFLNLRSWKLKSFKAKKVGKYKGRQMELKTRKKLAKFFNPYNEELFKLIGKNFDWD